MLTLLAIAQASNTLDFTRFELTGDASGVELAYTLAADDWIRISDGRREGRSTALAVTLEAQGVQYRAVLPLNAAARHVTLSRRAWPVGTWGLVAVHDSQDFQAVGASGREGRELRLQVQGGVDGARPINPPLSIDQGDGIDRGAASGEGTGRGGRTEALPVSALPAPEADEALDDDELHADDALAEAVAPVAPTPRPIASPAPPSGFGVPTDDDVRQACAHSFASDEDRAVCGSLLLGRVAALDELAACSSIARPRHQRACIEAIAQVSRPSVGLIEACTRSIGPNSDALGCVRAGVLHPVDPVPAVESCAAAISDPGDAIACVKRAARLTYPVEPLLQACSIGFPGDIYDCVARATRGTFDRADLVNACTTSWSGADRLRCLTILAPARGEDAAGVVRACVKLYEPRDQRFECMERARAVPSEARILHCGELRRTDDQMACIGG